MYITYFFHFGNSFLNTFFASNYYFVSKKYSNLHRNSDDFYEII